jgi:hypothetical protein
MPTSPTHRYNIEIHDFHYANMPNSIQGRTVAENGAHYDRIDEIHPLPPGPPVVADAVNPPADAIPPPPLQVDDDDVHQRDDAAVNINNVEHGLTQRELLIRKYKEWFLLRTRVCIKFLEFKDPPLHRQVLLIVNDCSRRNRNNEVGYDSVTLSLRYRLFKVVPDYYWSIIDEKVRKIEQQRKLLKSKGE